MCESYQHLICQQININMENNTGANFWWMKCTPLSVQEIVEDTIVPKPDLHSSVTLVDLLEKDNNSNCDVDVSSIIEEINKVAAQSPLGPYQKSGAERSIDDLMKEAEKIFFESSKSFEQLSQRSKTSQNISDLLYNHSNNSTPTPKSISPIPMDPGLQDSIESGQDYSKEFSEGFKLHTNLSNNQKSHESNIEDKLSENLIEPVTDLTEEYGHNSIEFYNTSEINRNGRLEYNFDVKDSCSVNKEHYGNENVNFLKFEKDLKFKNELIRTLEEDNSHLKFEIKEFKRQKGFSSNTLNILKIDPTITIANCRIKRAGNLYSKLKDITPSCKRSNVNYKISCRDCELSYIGNTSRNLEGRIISHRSDIRLMKN